MSRSTFTFTTSGGGSGGDGKPQLIAPGWHSFEIVNTYEDDINGNPLKTRKDVPFVKVVCQEFASEVIVFHHLFLEPEQAARVSAFMAAIGYEYKDGDEVVINPPDFVGQVFRGRVENKIGSDGVTRNKITRVASVPAPPPEETADDLEETDEDPPADPLADPDLNEDVPF